MEKQISTYIKSLLLRRGDINSFVYEDNQRSKNQKEIANTKEQTVFVDAPAGFGKTLSGLLWNFNSQIKS